MNRMCFRAFCLINSTSASDCEMDSQSLRILRAYLQVSLIAIIIIVFAWNFFSQCIILSNPGYVGFLWKAILTLIRVLILKIKIIFSFKALTTTIDYWKSLYITKTRLILCQSGQTSSLITSRWSKLKGYLHLRGWMHLRSISIQWWLDMGRMNLV